MLRLFGLFLRKKSQYRVTEMQKKMKKECQHVHHVLLLCGTDCRLMLCAHPLCQRLKVVLKY